MKEAAARIYVEQAARMHEAKQLIMRLDNSEWGKSSSKEARQLTIK